MIRQHKQMIFLTSERECKMPVHVMIYKKSLYVERESALKSKLNMVTHILCNEKRFLDLHALQPGKRQTVAPIEWHQCLSGTEYHYMCLVYNNLQSN